MYEVRGIWEESAIAKGNLASGGRDTGDSGLERIELFVLPIEFSALMS